MKSNLRVASDDPRLHQGRPQASDDPRILHRRPMGKVELARLKAVLDEQSGSGGKNISEATEAYLRFLERWDPPTDP